MPMLGLEPTYFVSEEYCCHALTDLATPAPCTNTPVHPSLAAQLASRTPRKINEV
jgi:hypothetical protein